MRGSREPTASERRYSVLRDLDWMPSGSRSYAQRERRADRRRRDAGLLKTAPHRALENADSISSTRKKYVGRADVAVARVERFHSGANVAALDSHADVDHREGQLGTFETDPRFQIGPGSWLTGPGTAPKSAIP